MATVAGCLIMLAFALFFIVAMFFSADAATWVLVAAVNVANWLPLIAGSVLVVSLGVLLLRAIKSRQENSD